MRVSRCASCSRPIPICSQPGRPCMNMVRRDALKALGAAAIAASGSASAARQCGRRRNSLSNRERRGAQAAALEALRPRRRRRVDGEHREVHRPHRRQSAGRKHRRRRAAREGRDGGERRCGSGHRRGLAGDAASVCRQMRRPDRCGELSRTEVRRLVRRLSALVHSRRTLDGD